MAVAFAVACGSGPTAPSGNPFRLVARPTANPAGPIERGVQKLNLGSFRDGLLFVPYTYTPERPLPLWVALHGSGGSGRSMMDLLEGPASGWQVIVLAPDARKSTWDLALGEVGPDVEFIDRALHLVFERYAVDERRIVLEGFSAGATEALAIGVNNPELFTHVAANSPRAREFPIPSEGRRAPIVLTQGLLDPVLPPDSNGRVLRDRLVAAGYPVEYVEGEFGHELTEAMVEDLFAWLVEGRRLTPWEGLRNVVAILTPSRAR